MSCPTAGPVHIVHGCIFASRFITHYAYSAVALKTVTHISARRFQYRRLQGSNFWYRSHLHRTVSFCPKISSYNLNFEIFVTHIKAPLLSTPIDLLYIALQYKYSVLSVSVCFTYSDTGSDTSQVVIEPKSVDCSYFLCVWCKYLLVATTCSFWPLEEFVVNKRGQ